MSIGGIGGIGGGGGNYIPPSGGAPGGGGPDDDMNKVGKERETEENKEVKKGDKLTLTTPDQQIGALEQMTHDQLATISPDIFASIATQITMITDPTLQARFEEMRRKARIIMGARAYRQTASVYPLPVQPVPPVNPDPLPNPDIPMPEKKDDEDEASDDGTQD